MTSAVDTQSSTSRQHYIDTGHYLPALDTCDTCDTPTPSDDLATWCHPTLNLCGTCAAHHIQHCDPCAREAHDTLDLDD